MFSFWAADDDFPVWRFHPSALRRVLEDTLGRMGTGGMKLSLLISGLDLSNWTLNGVNGLMASRAGAGDWALMLVDTSRRAEIVVDC